MLEKPKLKFWQEEGFKILKYYFKAKVCQKIEDSISEKKIIYMHGQKPRNTTFFGKKEKKLVRMPTILSSRN